VYVKGFLFGVLNSGIIILVNCIIHPFSKTKKPEKLIPSAFHYENWLSYFIFPLTTATTAPTTDANTIEATISIPIILKSMASLYIL